MTQLICLIAFYLFAEKIINSAQSWNVDINSPTTERFFTETTMRLPFRLNREREQQSEQ